MTRLKTSATNLNNLLKIWYRASLFLTLNVNVYKDNFNLKKESIWKLPARPFSSPLSIPELNWTTSKCKPMPIKTIRDEKLKG